MIFLTAADRVIFAFERLTEGCTDKSWAEWENGNGENIGHEIESALAEYRALKKEIVA